MVAAGSFLVFCIFALLFGLIFAAATSKIAESKGYTFTFPWALSGLLFGPIALLVAVAVPKREFGGSKLTTCVHCQSKIPVDASVCRYCQRDVEPAESAASRASALDQKNAEMTVEKWGPDLTFGCECGKHVSEIEDGQYVFAQGHSRFGCEKKLSHVSLLNLEGKPRSKSTSGGGPVA